MAVVTGYYRAIVTRNYRKAFGYLAPGATGPDGHPLTLASFLALARMLDGMGGPVTRFSIGADPSGVVMTLYRVRYGPYHAHLRMVTDQARLGDQRHRPDMTQCKRPESGRVPATVSVCW